MVAVVSVVVDADRVPNAIAVVPTEQAAATVPVTCIDPTICSAWDGMALISALPEAIRRKPSCAMRC